MKRFIKDLTQLYKAGEHLTVTISKPLKGNFPVGKLSNGVLVTFEFGTKGYWEYGTDWEVEVIAVKEKNLVAKPIKLVKSLKDKENDYQAKLAEFEEFSIKNGIKFTRK